MNDPNIHEYEASLDRSEEGSWAELTEDFARRNGYDSPREPWPPAVHLQLLRLRLMMEELGELSKAMHESSLVAVADGICDLLYVTVGTAVAYGLGPILDKLFREVHRSNMTKPAGSRAAAALGLKYSTEYVKGDGYSPPRLGELLDEYRDVLRRIREAEK